MSHESDKKVSDIEREDEDVFRFPLLCYPATLRAKTIYRIMTISDLVVSTFSSLMATLITFLVPVVAAHQTWYFVTIYLVYVVLFGLIIFLYCDMSFVSWRNKPKEVVLKRCKQYTLVR